MSETVEQMQENFFKDITVVILKEKLKNFGLATTGTKAALQVRLEEKFKTMESSELHAFLTDHVSITNERNELLANNANNNDELRTNHVLSNNENNVDITENAEDLDKELENLRHTLRKKQEIAKLKNEIANLDKNTCPKVNFRDVEESIPVFSGDDNLSVNKWVEIFEENIEMFEWDVRTSFIYAKKLLSGTAKLFSKTVSCMTWNEFKHLLIREFEKRVTSADIHNQLRGRRKMRTETFQQYVLAMQEIASYSNLDESDIINYIIKGIPDSEINKIILYNNTDNMVNFKHALNIYEKMKANQNSEDQSRRNWNHETSRQKSHPDYYRRVDYMSRFGNTPRVNNAQRVDNIPRVNNAQRVDNVRRVDNTRCFNCNEYGHTANRCNKSRRVVSCFNCGQEGHFSINCPKQMIPVMSVNQDDDDHQAEQASTKFNSFHSHEFESLLRYEFVNPFTKSKVAATLMTIIDSGSPVSFVKQQHIPSGFIHSLDEATASCKFTGINGSCLHVIGKVKCNVSYKKKIFVIDVLVVNNNSMKYEVVLGRDFFKLGNLKLKFDEKDNDAKLNDLENKLDSDINFTNDILNIDISDNETCIDVFVNDNLPFNVKKSVQEIISMKSPLLKVQKNECEIKIDLIKHKIFNCTPRRLPHVHKIELQKLIDDLLNRKVIRESNSEYASPIVLVRKKTGEFRLCVDYRDLNRVTLKINYPIPLIEDYIDQLRGKKYFSILDLRNGFYHVKVADESVKYTSFVTPMGQFEFLRMPFGLKNGPGVFQRFINSKFKKLIVEGKLLPYIDDLFIATETIEEHLIVLKEVMTVVRENQLQLRYDKCKFLLTNITYLGYEINENGVSPTEKGIRAVKNFPIPKNSKDVHSFLGLCSYFRKFIQNFSVIAKPLYDLIRKDVPFRFGQNELNVFECLKMKLQQSPVLSIYNPNAETELHCDASSVGFGAVLLQRQEDKKFHPIFFFSKRANSTESKYHSYELETLAIIYALRRFKVYLIGINFKIITDCQALTLTLNKKHLNPRISRWALELQEFSYTIEHRNSSRMSHVDSLSRCHNILVVEDDVFEHALISAQQRDPTIRKITEMLEKKESGMYEMINGVVYRKFENEVLFFVPKQMERNVIQTHHESLCHAGSEKCYEYLKKTYWFPNLKSKIKNYISTCLKCLYYSPISGKKEGTLHNIPKGKLPFETIHIDHFGPLPTSCNKKKHIFLIVDGFTKFTKLYPVRTTDTKEVIQCLESYFNSYSRPTRIVSDRGRCFTSEDFAKFSDEQKIQHIKVATLSPQSNGQVERVNRVLSAMLSKSSDSSTSDWTKYIPQVEFAINNIKNRSTNFTPSTLLFGVAQKRSVTDNIFEFIQNVIKPPVNRNLKQLRKEANRKIKNSQSYNKRYFDKRHKAPRKYKEGDYVLIKNIVTVPGINKKLLPKYKGPYVVHKVLKNDRYVIKDIDGMQISRVHYKGVWSPENMKPYCTYKNNLLR